MQILDCSVVVGKAQYIYKTRAFVWSSSYILERGWTLFWDSICICDFQSFYDIEFVFRWITNLWHTIMQADFQPKMFHCFLVRNSRSVSLLRNLKIPSKSWNVTQSPDKQNKSENLENDNSTDKKYTHRSKCIMGNCMITCIAFNKNYLSNHMGFFVFQTGLGSHYFSRWTV